jgi:hypothetical protein
LARFVVDGTHCVGLLLEKVSRQDGDSRPLSRAFVPLRDLLIGLEKLVDLRPEAFIAEPRGEHPNPEPTRIALRDDIGLLSIVMRPTHCPIQLEEFEHGILEQDEGVPLKALDCKTPCLAPILASKAQGERLGDESAHDGAHDRQTATSKKGEDELSCVHRKSEPRTYEIPAFDASVSLEQCAQVLAKQTLTRIRRPKVGMIWARFVVPVCHVAATPGMARAEPGRGQRGKR